MFCGSVQNVKFLTKFSRQIIIRDCCDELLSLRNETDLAFSFSTGSNEYVFPHKTHTWTKLSGNLIVTTLA